MQTDDFIIYWVTPGEDASVKKQQAWEEYIAKGGYQEYERILFIQINDFSQI